MMPAEIDKRIFVVGAPRSGTTLVQSLLASHREATSFTESHFFSRHFRVLPLIPTAILVRDPSARVQEFLAENQSDAQGSLSWLEEAGGVCRPAVPPPLQTRAVARRLLSVLDTLALQRGRSTWIEKTPKHLRYLPFLERTSGSERNTQFVHVIRDGLEVVASLNLASQDWEESYDLDTCIKRWNDDVGVSLSRISSARDHFLFYEDLIVDPTGTLRLLLAALELEWQPDLLTRFGETSEPLITQQERWKHNIGSEVRSSATSIQRLSDAQRSLVQSGLRPGLYRRLREQTRAENRKVGR